MLDSDDAVSTDLLAGLLQVVADAGGWLHPAARLVARDRQLSVHSAAEDGQPLLHVPRAALVRVGRVEWAVSDGAVIPAGFDDSIDGAELEALFLLTGLLNQCGKLPELMRVHPLLAPDLPADLVASVQKLRPSFGSARPDPVSLLWSTRCFRVSFDDAPAEPVAVPILELMNHRTGSAIARPAQGGFDVETRTGDNDECFLDYGRDRDAISMALVYGFADASAQLAHSAPLDIEVPGVGRVLISSCGRNRTGELLPVMAHATSEGLTINRLTFGAQCAPEHELARATDWSLERATAVVDAVRQANIGCLEDVMRTARAADSSAAAATLGTAAGIQQAIFTERSWGSQPPAPIADGEFAVECISEDDVDLGQWRGR